MQADDGAQVGIDSHNVADSRGVNNDYIQRVRYAFGQSSFKRTVLSLSEDSGNNSNSTNGTNGVSTSPGFDIPEELVSKQTGQYSFRLDMVDFKLKDDPFSFSLASTKTGEVLIDTTDQTFVFQKKFV